MFMCNKNFYSSDILDVISNDNLIPPFSPTRNVLLIKNNIEVAYNFFFISYI